MTLRRVMTALLAAAVIAIPLAGTVSAQAKEMFIPSLVYRTGPYAPSGIPFANGLWDYLTMLNERDGGVNGGNNIGFLDIDWKEGGKKIDAKYFFQ